MIDAAPSRRTKRRRQQAERSKPRPEWTRLEPRSREGNISDRAVSITLVTLLVAALVGWQVELIRDVVRWQNLRSRGQNASAVVVDVTGYNRDNRDDYFVYTFISECSCTVKVKIKGGATYDDGEHIPVRYDPHDHSNAEALADRAESGLPLAIPACALVSSTAVVLGIRELRRRRRARALIGSGAPKRSVQFQAWRWKLGDTTKHYLVLLDAGASDWSEPLGYVPVQRHCLRRLRPSDVLQLYGGEDAKAPAVLRHEGTVIVPTGPIIPGRRARERVG